MVGPRPVNDFHERRPTAIVVISSGGSDDATNTDYGWSWVAGPESPAWPTQVTWREVIKVSQIAATMSVKGLVFLGRDDAVGLNVRRLAT